MYIAKISLVIILLSNALVHAFDSEKKEAASKLYEIQNKEEQILTNIHNNFRTHISSNIEFYGHLDATQKENFLKELINVFQSKGFLRKYKSAWITVYCETFTLSELVEIGRFYSTDTGKKLINSSAELANKGEIKTNKIFSEKKNEFNNIFDKYMKTSNKQNK